MAKAAATWPDPVAISVQTLFQDVQGSVGPTRARMRNAGNRPVPHPGATGGMFLSGTGARGLLAAIGHGPPTAGWR